MFYRRIPVEVLVSYSFKGCPLGLLLFYKEGLLTRFFDYIKDLSDRGSSIIYRGPLAEVLVFCRRLLAEVLVSFSFKFCPLGLILFYKGGLLKRLFYYIKDLSDRGSSIL